MRVIFTPLAERHIDKLYDYIATRSGEARADGFVTRIVAFCNGLTTFPMRGRPRDDILPGLRIAGFERSINIAFTIAKDAVLIEGVFYGGRNYETVLRRQT